MTGSLLKMYLLREHAVIGIIASKLERDIDAVLSREALLFPPFPGGPGKRSLSSNGRKIYASQ